MEIKITQATDAHIQGIAELWKESMGFHEEIDAHFAVHENAHTDYVPHLQEVMQKKDAQVLVALDKERVVAYSVSLLFERPPVFEERIYGFISDLAVTSDYRRKGIGGKLLDSMIEWFESKNVKRIELRVVAQNDVGYSFWRKHGFRDFMHELYITRKL
ncbi:MAG: GNAT family N-acetyltransferase [Theionarchaea archaeon]|nr:GNAT family N-acetyltransferase [Theionarchaea archaeon]